MDASKNGYRQTNGPTDQPTDQRTDGWTKPLIEMRGRILWEIFSKTPQLIIEEDEEEEEEDEEEEEMEEKSGLWHNFG